MQSFRARRRRAWALGIASACLLAADVASGDASDASHGTDLSSVFFIAKSENKNEVHYGIHVGPDCTPAGAAPLFAYWLMLEKGPGVTEPLLSRELPAYGFASQRLSPSRGANGGSVTVTLRALPDRPIVVSTWSVGGSCAASSEAEIAGTPSLLTRVFVRLRWPFGVESLTLDGYATADRRPVRERIAK
jgi:hypothetical protein